MLSSHLKHIYYAIASTSNFAQVIPTKLWKCHRELPHCCNIATTHSVVLVGICPLPSLHQSLFTIKRYPSYVLSTSKTLCVPCSPCGAISELSSLSFSICTFCNHLFYDVYIIEGIHDIYIYIYKHIREHSFYRPTFTGAFVCGYIFAVRFVSLIVFVVPKTVYRDWYRATSLVFFFLFFAFATANA